VVVWCGRGCRWEAGGGVREVEVEVGRCSPSERGAGCAN
jgi:hypothetical protein